MAATAVAVSAIVGMTDVAEAYEAKRASTVNGGGDAVRTGDEAASDDDDVEVDGVARRAEGQGGEEGI